MLGIVKDIMVEFTHSKSVSNTDKKMFKRYGIPIHKNTVGVTEASIKAVIENNGNGSGNIFITIIKGYAIRADGDNFVKQTGKVLSFNRAYQECPRSIKKAVREKYDISKWINKRKKKGKGKGKGKVKNGNI